MGTNLFHTIHRCVSLMKDGVWALSSQVYYFDFSSTFFIEKFSLLLVLRCVLYMIRKVHPELYVIMFVLCFSAGDFPGHLHVICSHSFFPPSYQKPGFI